MDPWLLCLSVTRLVREFPQLYWSNVPILWQQLMSVNSIARHPELSTQHYLWPFPETASLRHLKKISVDSLPFRPMRAWHGHKVDGKVCKVIGRERG